MLLELHVRNLALIEKADIEFTEGLNILTGETGAGKSIIIGSVNMALGGKTSRDSIRTGAENAYIELLFSVTDPAKIQALKALDAEPDEDGTLIISRKITPSRSINMDGSTHKTTTILIRAPLDNSVQIAPIISTLEYHATPNVAAKKLKPLVMIDRAHALCAFMTASFLPNPFLLSFW